MSTPDIRATIGPIPGGHYPYPEYVRLTWHGHYADFDACPIRGLSAIESATEWAGRVCGIPPESIATLAATRDRDRPR